MKMFGGSDNYTCANFYMSYSSGKVITDIKIDLEIQAKPVNSFNAEKGLVTVIDGYKKENDSVYEYVTLFISNVGVLNIGFERAYNKRELFKKLIESCKFYSLKININSKRLQCDVDNVKSLNIDITCSESDSSFNFN